MEPLHTYSDGSVLYKTSASNLIQIPIWHGNRICDASHVKKIATAVGDNVQTLDSGYIVFYYLEQDENNLYKRKFFLGDGQHRYSVLSDYFSKHPQAKDFPVTVTVHHVESEEDAIKYFNRINTVKPMQFEEDPNMIINRYIVALSEAFPKKSRFIRTTATKRPYMSADRFREQLHLRLEGLKKLPTETFVKKCLDTNNQILSELKDYTSHKEQKMIERILELEFALAWDDKFGWLNSIL
jgi:hypothetical protein